MSECKCDRMMFGGVGARAKMSISPEELARWKALCDATDAAWPHPVTVADFHMEARKAMPRLLDEVERMRNVLAKAFVYIEACTEGLPQEAIDRKWEEFLVAAGPVREELRE